MAQLRLTFLGTGTSHGVPVIGCRCAVCLSPDPRNHRLRASLLVETETTVVVIDTGPEFRLQALRARIDHVDAICLTHAHSDHIMGLDDVRAYNYRMQTPMPIYGSATTLNEVRHRFSYAFDDGPEGGGKPKLDLVTIDGAYVVGDLEILPLDVLHGDLVVTAYRMRPVGGGPEVAYVTDTNRIPPSTVARLRNLDLLILDALGPHLHPTHYSLAEATAMAVELQATQTLFTHMSHSLEHVATCADLPDGIALAYDEQVVSFAR